MRNHFWLIQRGQIKESTAGCLSLLGSHGIIALDYMGSAEFEWGALPRAWWRIMGDYENYALVRTGIFACNKRELMLFCKKERVEEVIKAINDYIDNPYQLKEFSNLDRIKTPADIRNPFSWFSTRFWWCIDKNDFGDWMAFFDDESNKIYEAIQHDYKNWWLTISDEERRNMVKKAHSSNW